MNEETTFEEYCTAKNINHEAFHEAEPSLYTELKEVFNQVSPLSFTQQKLYLINNIRRKYQLDTFDK